MFCSKNSAAKTDIWNQSKYADSKGFEHVKTYNGCRKPQQKTWIIDLWVSIYVDRPHSITIEIFVQIIDIFHVQKIAGVDNLCKI